MKFKTIFCVIIFSLVIIGFLMSEEKYNDNWPNWRGPNDDGVSLNSNPLTEWSETKNVKWKTPIPGKGLGTPVIWGDQIFITTAIKLDEKGTKEAIKRLKKRSNIFFRMTPMNKSTKNILQFVVYSIDRNTGEIIWQKVAREQFPHEGVHKEGSWASASCVTDGNHVIASFGSYGVYCFDLKGEMIWEKDLGDMQVEATFGEGASPVLYKDKLIILWDHQGQSKLFVLNKESGEEIWQKDREEGTTWTTPIVVEIEGNTQIVVPGETKSIGYDLVDGNEIWELAGLGDGVISCPVFDGERVFLMTGFMKSKIVQAVDLKSAKGNLENSDAVIWTYDKGTSYVPSPLLKDGKLYYLKGSRAQISCVDSKTGKIYYDTVKPEGMKGAYASPVAANGYIYFIDRKGNCSVIKEGEKFELVSQNKLDDNFDASPVTIGDQLFLRGWNSLYCISK